MKIVKRVALGCLALILLVVIGVSVKFYGLSPKSRPAPDVKAPNTPEAIARGKYLVNNVAACVGCHSPVQEDKPGDRPVEGKLGSGRDFGPWEGAPFHLRAPNLTPDPDTGIGKYTDGEILRGIREGIGKDGHALFPMMPYPTYAKTLSDDDALAIIAYLRTLPPIKNDPGKTEVKFPVSMFIRGAPQPLTQSAPPPPTEKMARGKWLLEVCSCHDCHDSFDGKRQPIEGKALGGGAKFPLPNGKGTAIASNISSDKATGIGAYTDDDIRRVFTEGKGKSGRSLYTMPWSYYGGMTEEDREALIAALRAEPPVVNAVPPSDIK